MNTKLKKGALEKEPAFKYTLLASEKLKLRRTTLIEKMKKLAIEKPNLWTISINYIL